MIPIRDTTHRSRAARPAPRLKPFVAALAAALTLTLLAATPAALAQGVRAMSTGVGKDERVAHADYSVRFEFARLAGAYLANVSVQVRGAGGTVLDTVAEGPWLFADLEPGDYRVLATAQGGEKQGAEFTVSGNGQKVVRLAWR